LAANPIHSRLALAIFDTATLWMATDMVANAIRAGSGHLRKLLQRAAMVEVQKNMAQLKSGDRNAIAAYLKAPPERGKGWD